MSRILVWDAPTRVLHFGIAATVLGALAIGLTADDDSPFFVYHMLCGLAAVFLVALRIVLGIVGSRYSRFSSWAWSPAGLVRYAKGVVRGDAARYVGHNPGTTWMAALVFVSVGLLIATGLAGGGEFFEEVHEALAYGLIGLIALHLAGIGLHTFQQRENVARWMVDGRKEGPPEAALASGRGAAGLMWAALAAMGLAGLWRGYDAATRRLRVPLVGREISLDQKNEHGEGGERREHRQGHEGRDD